MKRASFQIARRRFPRIGALWLPTAVLGILSFLGFYHAVKGVREEDVLRWRGMAGSESLQQLPHAVETDFNIRFVPSFSARTLVFGLQPETIRAAGPQNVVSPHGYVFVPEDMQVPYGRSLVDRSQNRPADAIRVISALSEKLQNRNIRLLVVPLPAKSSLLPQELDAEYDASKGPLLNCGHEAWFAALRGANVDVYDPTFALWDQRNVAPLFYQADTHWTQFAKIVTAKAIAPTVTGWLNPTTPLALTERPINMKYVCDSVDPLRESREIMIAQTQLLVDGLPAQFGNEAPVLIIGDSYAEQFCKDGAGFSQMLARELGLPVQNAAEFGVTASRMVYQVDTPPQLLQKKKVVILLFALRKLQCNDWISDPPAAE